MDDIYPVEKVALFLIYICLYEGSNKDLDYNHKYMAIENAPKKIAAFILFVFLFNTLCACIMETGWNKSLLNEYVYETGNINVRKNMEFNSLNFKIEYDLTNTIHDRQVAQGIGNAIVDDPEAKKNVAILVAHSFAPDNPTKRKEIYSLLGVQGSQTSDDAITTDTSDNDNNNQNDDNPLISVNPSNDKSSGSGTFAPTIPHPVPQQQIQTQNQEEEEFVRISKKEYLEFRKFRENKKYTPS